MTFDEWLIESGNNLDLDSDKERLARIAWNVACEYKRDYIEDMEDTLEQLADIVGCAHNPETLITAIENLKHRMDSLEK